MILKNHLNNFQRPHILPECLSDYDICIKAKLSQKLNHRKQTIKAKLSFERIHIDLCRQMRTKSMGGTLYYAVFVCNKTWITWCYPLKKKSDDIYTWRDFQAWVRKRNYLTRYLRADNSGKFETLLVDLSQDGIKWKLSPLYIQHCNSIAKRIIQTLNNKYQCMLFNGKIPAIFWAEAIITATYLHSITPQRLVN